MNRSRTMRIALLASTALVAAVGIPALQADETISSGATLDLGAATVFHNNLILEDGFLINGTFDGSVLFDVRKGQIAAALAGTGALVKSTTDTVVLLGANTYTGGTTISGGTLVVDDGGTLGASGSSLSILSGGTLDLTGATQTVGTLSLTGNAVITGGIFFPDPHAVLSITGATVNAGVGETAAIDVDLVSTGTITKNGLGTLRIGGCCNSGLTGPIDVNAGTLQLVWQNSPGASTINMNGASTLSLNNGAGNGQNFYNTVNLNGAGVKIDSAENISVQRGVLSGSFGFEKTGAGVLGLTRTNTYTGLTTISGGVLQLQDDGFGDYGSVAGDIFLNGGSLALVRTDSALNLAGSISGAGQIFTSGAFGSATLSGNNTFSGGVFLFSGTMRAGSSTAYGSGLIGGMPGTLFDLNGFDVSVGGLSGGEYDLDGRVLTLTGTTGFATASTFTPGSITIAGGGQHVFSGVDLSNVSTLTVNGTAVVMGSGNVAPGLIALGAGGTFEIDGLGGVSYVAPQISGSGSIALGDKLLETGGSNASTTLSGTISGFGGSLKKVGTGTLTLSGTNTFSGGIEVAGGTLSLASNGAAGTGPITTTGSVIDYGAGVDNAAPIILNSTTTQLQVTGSATQSGVISEIGGSRPLEKIGNGVLTMTAANTYTGTTTISAGRIILSGAGEILGDVHIANNSPNDFFQISKNSNYTYGGVISGYNVALTGTGTTTWTGANTHAYTGITDGTLTFSGAGTLGAANTWVLMSGGTVDLNGTTQSAGIFTLYDGGTGLVTNGNLNVSTTFYADSGTMAANLSGTAVLAKFSGGASVLSGTNTYTGQTFLNGGTLVAQGGSAISDTSAVNIASGATLQIDNDETIGSLAGAGNVSLGGNTLTTGGTNAVTTFSGALSGTGGMTKVGTANFTLTGANTYTGLTTVIGGRMKLGNGGAIAGDIHIVDNGQAWFDFEQSGSYTYSGTLSGGQISQGGAGTTTLSGVNSNNYLGIAQGTLAVSGSGTLGASNVMVGISGVSGTGTLDLGGTTQNISVLTMFAGWDNAVVNGTLNASSFLYADEGVISANLAGTATLIKSGAGTTTLSGNNTYSGQTDVNAGTLVLQGGNAIDDSNAVSVAGGATLQLDGDEEIGSLAGAGNLALTTKTLTVGGNNTSTSWSGTILGGLTSGLQKTGTGTLSVSGNLNQESTTVAGGELNFNGTALGNIAVNAGARLSGTNTINGNLINLGTLASGNSPGTTTVLGNYTGGGVLDVEVQFNNAGAPINGTTHDFLDIAGNVLGSPTAINLLTFAPSGAPAATVGNGIQIVRVGGTTSASDFTMSSYLLGSYFYDLAYIADYSGSDDGFFLQSSLAAPGCSVTVGNDACFVDSTTSQVTPIDALAGSDTLQLTGGTNFNFDVATIGTVFTNFESYQKADTSTVTLTGVAGFSSLGFDVQNGTLVAGTGQLGATGANNILTPGVLQVASNLTTGSIAGTGSVVLNANLATGGNNLSTTFSGDISGTGGLTKEGTGTFTLSGANSYDGVTNVNAGVLSIMNAQALGTTVGGTVVASGAALEIGGAMVIGAEALTLNGSGISNGGALRHITGVVDYTGDITLGSASRINSDSLLGNLNITGAIGGAGQDLTVGGVGNTQFIGNIATGTGSFTKDGSGSVQLFGTNSYTGVTTVNAGLLSLAGGNAIEDSGEVVVNGGVLTVTTSERIGSLAGGAGTSVQLNAETLTAGGNNLSTAYDGVISGTGSFDKEGSGTLTLSGANDLTGNMRLNQGGLTIAGSGTLGASTVGLFVQGTLDLGGTSQTVGSLGMSAGSIQNGSLTVNGSAFAQVGDISADLTVTGTFSKAFGGGSLTLSGTNTLSSVGIGSGTLIAANDAALTDTASVNMSYIGFGVGPRLQINTNQTIGSVSGDIFSSVDLGGNVLTTGGNNSSTTLSGAISGAGKLVKTGSGMFTLGGLNSFTGGIDLMQGGIRLLNNSAAGTGPITTFGSVISYANAVNSATPIIVNSNTTQLEVLAADVAQQSGVISEIGGSRPIEKIGTGTLTLSGANTYTGATTITAGTLNVTGGSALSNSAAVNIGAAGTLSVSASESVGSLSGSGILGLSSGSILTTGLDNSSSVFSGASSGLGGLTKTGLGTMTLTGNNAFTGAFVVANGNLTVTPSGSLNGMSSFSVQGGASAFLGSSVQGVNGGGMTGAGLGALSVNTAGTMYLDDNTSLSGATLNMASGSNLNLFLTTNTSQYPQINLSGSANIANANVGVYLDPITFSGTLATSFTYSNVISGSGVTGTFGSVNLLQSPSGLFTVAGIYTPTSAGIQVTRNAFSTLGGGGSNNDNVGDALEDIFTGGPSDPDIINLITVIGTSPPSTIPSIFTMVAGAENSENTGAGLRTDDPWKQSVAERVNAARTTGCTVAGESWCLRRYAQASTSGGEVMSDVLGDPTAFDWLETGIRDAGSTSVWGRAIGAWGESQGDVNGPGSSQWTGGMIAGADRVFSSLLLAGVAMQYVETSVDFDSSENKSTVRSGQFGAYVSYGGAEAFVNGNLSLIGTQASANRYMSIGLLDYDVHSFARSWALTASVEGGTIMEIDGYRFEPTLAFNYQGAYPVDFKENGGGGLSLIVHPDDSNSLRSILSARVSRVFDIGDRNLVPQLRVDWRHEMLDRRQEFSAAFAGDPTVFFDVDGATYARDVFSAGASLTMPITGRVMGYVDAQGAFSEDSTSAMVSVGGRATW